MSGCVSLGAGVVVCGVVTNDQLRRRILWCPMEERRQEMAVRYEMWFGLTLFCCGCGDQWSDGERVPRPFTRYWRRDRLRLHRKLWDRATYGEDPIAREFRELAEEERRQEDLLALACEPCMDAFEMSMCRRVVSGDGAARCEGPRPTDPNTSAHTP